MDVNSLKSTEVDYEIKIRSQVPSGDVDNRRKILRGLLSQERGNRSFISILNPFTFDEDVKEIEETIADLQQLISSLTDPVNANVLKRITARLTHISGRVHRMNVEDVDQRGKQTGYAQQVLLLEADFDEKIKPPSSTPRDDRVFQLGDPQLSPILPRSHSLVKPILPYKWNISFTGSSSEESVISFLEKVESLRVARGVSKNDLFRAAGDLFKAQAWTWFNTNRTRFTDWDDLVLKLRQDFLPYNYDEDLLEEINHRTQGHDEKSTLYICAMEGLFNRLSKKPDEQTIVNRIRRNLLPQYVSQLALHEIKTISELTSLVKRLEESHTWSMRYKPPVMRKNQLLEPDLSFYPNTSFRFTSRNVSTLSLHCWNCSKPGHMYQNCPSPRQLFCYGCGAKNIVKSKCQKCSKNFRGSDQPLESVASTSKSPILFPFRKTSDPSKIKNNSKKSQ